MDYEGLFDLDPATADALRAKYGGGGDAVGGAAGAAPHGGALDVRSALGLTPQGVRLPPPDMQVDGPFKVFQNGSAKPVDITAALGPAPTQPIGPPPPPWSLGKELETKLATPAAPRPAPSEQPTASAAPVPAPQQAPQPMVGGAPVVVPGHWSPSSTESETRRKGSPEDIESMRAASDSAAGHSLLSADAQLRAVNRDIDADALELARKREVADRYEALAAKTAMERQQYVEGQKAKLQGMSEELAKDPTSQYWASKDDGEKVQSFIGVLLSSIGAGMTGGPNLALQKIDSEINRSFANRQNAYARQNGIYQEMLKEYGDRSTAIAAAKVAAYDKVMMDLAPMRSLAKTDRAKSDYEKIVSGVEANRAKAIGDFTGLVETTEKSKDTYKPAQVIGGAGPGKPLDNTATLSDGTSVQFQNSEQGNKAVEKFQAHAKVQALYNTAKQLRAKTAEAAPGSAEHEAAHRQLEKIASDIIYEESMARGQGVVKEDEMRRGLETSPILAGVGSRGLVGYASKINPWTSRDFAAGNKGIDAALQQSETEQRALVKAAGGRIINRGYAKDVAGKITPTGEYTGQDLKPDQQLAPEGFKPLDSRKDIAKAARKLADITPMAPMRKK